MAASAGLFLDPWQRNFLNEALLEKPDKTYAATDVGLCVCRQNGKGSVIEAVELADLFLLPTETVFHTAHLFDTSKEALQRLLVLIESTPDLDRYFSSHQGRIWLASGQEGVQLVRDGKKRRAKFKTRTKGSVRGLTGDRIFVDEAMYYTAEMDAALRPAISARSMQAGTSPQVWQTGSAGSKESVQFGRLRSRALEGKAPRLVWAEWSIEPCSIYCPDGCDRHDPHDSVASWAKANPGLGIRISAEHVESELMAMDYDMFLRERLGVGDWPVEGEAYRIIDRDAWISRVDPLSRPERPMIFGVDTTPDRSRSTIVAAAANGEGMCHIEITGEDQKFGKRLVDCRKGTRWVVDRLVELNERWKPVAVVIDKGTQAGVFIDELEAAGITLWHPTMREYATSCGQFASDVIPRDDAKPTIVHLDQPQLTSAVASADKREISDVWAWDKRAGGADISPLIAATLAHWGFRYHTNRARPAPNFAWG